MTIKEIIQKLHITMTDASGQESHFESWMTLNDGICDAIDALKALDKQEPVGQLLEDAFGRGQVMWFNKPKDESMLYTTPPQIEVGCAECGVNDNNHALYCVTCAENYLKDKNT